MKVLRVGAVVLTVTLLGAWAVLWFSTRGDRPRGDVSGGVSTAGITPPSGLFGCGRCHAVPPPDSLAREDWPRVIRSMNERVISHNLGEPVPPGDLEEVIRYYVAAAPESLPVADPVYQPSPLRFKGQPFGIVPSTDPSAPVPMLGTVTLADLDRNGRPEVLVCDIRDGKVSLIVSGPSGFNEGVIADLPAPCRAEAADIDGDGSQEIAVACLGSIVPTDDPVGRVVILRVRGDEVSRTDVLSNVGRAADARVADLDGDRLPDLAVGLFGQYKSGGVTVLWQGPAGQFSPQPLMMIGGVSHTPPADLDGDGLIDIAALISQEHERIVLFHNRGARRFEQRVLFQAPHPMYGLSCLEAADLDRDGDPDLLFTSGDALDFSTTPKPYHGVRWLENQGGLRFALREIAAFPGAYSAVAGDLDGDGDPDIVATSMRNHWDRPGAQSIIWFQNAGGGRFIPHPLDTGPTSLVSAAIADLSGDGRPDVVASSLNLIPPNPRVGRLTVWQNLGRSNP